VNSGFLDRTIYLTICSQSCRLDANSASYPASARREVLRLALALPRMQLTLLPSSLLIGGWCSSCALGSDRE
jgi:hypothetical protein